MRNKSGCICVTNFFLSLSLSVFLFPSRSPFLGFIVARCIPRPEPSTRNIVGAARTTLLMRGASFSPDNFEERPLANKGCDNLYKWRRKIVGFSSTLPCRNLLRQQDYGFFSIFDEYRGNEYGMESFHRRLDRVVSSLPWHFRMKRDTSGVLNELRFLWKCERSKPADAPAFPETSSFDVILWRWIHWLKFVLMIYV